MRRGMIALVVLPLLLPGWCVGQPAWTAGLHIQANGIDLTLYFGGAEIATDLFDDDLDVLAPPAPPASYYVSFLIGDPNFPNLGTDIRGWVAPYDAAIDWTLVVTNADTHETTISWDATELPPEGDFLLVDASTVDMRSESSVTFTGNSTLTIQYRVSGILGDVSGDDAVNSTDALYVLACDVGIDVSQFCPMNCGDTNDDRLVNSTDALVILAYDVGITVPYPVGQPGCPSDVTPCPGCTP